MSKRKKKNELYFVDLAGSENAKKTGAEGENLKESRNINKSINALDRVIQNIAENSEHVPSVFQSSPAFWKNHSVAMHVQRLSFVVH